MNILAIDIGTYSVKFIELKPERKIYTLVDKQEIILEEIKCHYPHIDNHIDLQREVIANFIKKKSTEFRIIFQIPSELITTRYLDIPAPSRKKAEMIIPFQLDENLPYPLTSAHYSSRISKNGNSFSVLSNITQLSSFNDFYSHFENKEYSPSILTTEVSIMQAYVEQVRMNESCCIIDMGHKTSKVYFVVNRQIVSNHISHIAGSNVNDVISKTYQISLDDAVLYKHANAFLLNDEQLDEVSSEQKDFALLMKQIFSPLVSDIRRWEIGHRVKFGTSIDKIYLIGGTSSIKNIENFIHYHTAIPVEKLRSNLNIKNDHDQKETNFLLAKIMGINANSPQQIINLLVGKFQNASTSFLSLHSSAFIATRVYIIALVLIAGLTIEKYVFLNSQQKTLDTKIRALIKRTNLGISNNDRKTYAKNPNRILSIIKKKNQTIKDEVSSIYSSQEINALKPLALLSNIVAANKELSLEKFHSDGFNVEATFSSPNTELIAQTSRTLKNSSLLNLSVKLNQEGTNLTVIFEDQK